MATQTSYGQPALYNQVEPALSVGAPSALNVDSGGRLWVTMLSEDKANTAIRTYDYGTFANITTQTTTVVKATAGYLRHITFTATANGVITIYNNTAASGEIIRTITSPATLLASHEFIPFNCSFSVGLTIVTATANQDIGVSYF